MFWKHIEGFYLKTGSLVVFWVYILFCCFDIKIWIQMLFVLLFFKWHWKNKLWINCTFLLFWDTFFFRITKCAFCFCCKTFFVFWGVVLVTRPGSTCFRFCCLCCLPDVCLPGYSVHAVTMLCSFYWLNTSQHLGIQYLVLVFCVCFSDLVFSFPQSWI